MTRPVPGARVVPRPVARTSQEAATDEFWQRCQRADSEQRNENLKASRQPAGSMPVASPPVPAATPPREAASYTPGVPSWPSYAECLEPEPAAGPADPFAIPADAPSMADRVRARHGLAAAAPDAVGALTLAEMMWWHGRILARARKKR